MREHGQGLDLASGIGLVVANMIGAGVFLSTGFMAQNMGPGPILLAWVVGAGLALAGARAYAEVARIVPRSGGEYRFLSDLLHPFLGYLAGWGSLLLGFSAPIAVDAFAAGSFLQTLVPAAEPRVVGGGLIVTLTALHAAGFRYSTWTQNLLVSVKALLLLGFVTVGLVMGRNVWPTWTPPTATSGFPLEPFMGSLFFIAFAFSGWNAAVYAAEEFRAPERDVPRAMLIGCAVVAVFYLLVNWVFIANLTPGEATAVFNYESSRITLGHLLMRDLVGKAGGAVTSVLIIVAFISSMSAMILVGPRVYAAMAGDGFLPRRLGFHGDRPPVGSVILQGGLALLLLVTHELRQVLQNVGAILVFFAALTTLSLFRVRFGRRDLPRPRPASLVAAAIYTASAAWMLYFGFKNSSGRLWLWMAVVTATALVAGAVTRRPRAAGAPLPKSSASPPP